MSRALLVSFASQVVVQSQLAVVLHSMATCPADVWASAAVSTALVALLDLLQVHDGCVSLTACAPLVFGARLRMLLHFLLALAHDAASLNAVGVPRLLTGRSLSSLGRPTRLLRWWTRAVCWPCVSRCFDPGPVPMAHPAPAVPCLVAKRRLRAPWVACCGCWSLRPVQGVDPPFGPSSSATCRMWCWALSFPPRLHWRPLTPCTAACQGDCGQRSELRGRGGGSGVHPSWTPFPVFPCTRRGCRCCCTSGSFA